LNSTAEAEVEGVEAVIKMGVIAYLRQDDVGVSAGLVDASGSIGFGNEGI
jgi:hypothetical protein